MASDETMVIDTNEQYASKHRSLDPALNCNDGRTMFYRAELFLNDTELIDVNSALAASDSQFGKAQMIEVKTPPLIPVVYPAAFVPTTFSPLPARSTRSSLPNYGTSSRSSAGGKVKVTEEKVKTEVVSSKPEQTQKPIRNSEPAPGPRFSEAPKTNVIPTIKPNTGKVQEAIRKVFDMISADPDYTCLQSEFQPPGMFPSPPMSLSIMRDRVESTAYDDHFQFMDDIVAMCTYWIQGPPQPNPILPHYLASLKLLRNGTDIMMSFLVGEIANDDYYAGPDVDEAIRMETKREDAEMNGSRRSSTKTSPSFARKIKKSVSSTSGAGGAAKAGPDSQLRTIEQQVSMLTQQVLGLQKTSGSRATPRQNGSTGAATSAADNRPLSADDIRKLESDLMTLEPEDIDHIVNTILKDEPSVRIDDESYELDVSALPAVKQRNLRRFVTRKLNMRDPSHGAQKLKQLLKDDELAMESEQIAERLLATSALPSPVGVPALPPVPVSFEEAEAERQRQERERRREEEAKRLWQLAHGDDDSMDMD